MKNITIYTTRMCPYCFAAIRLLKEKGASYIEIDVTMNQAERAVMTTKAGGVRSVPQIFIGDDHVGGCDDLYALEQSGQLSDMIAAS